MSDSATRMPARGVFALEQIRRMRGGAQSHLMRCSDRHYYVVKFQNNPQHRRILVNEMLGTLLAAALGLPVTPVRVIYVSEELIRLTPQLCMEMPRARISCHDGPNFGSRYIGDPRCPSSLDHLSDEEVSTVVNRDEFIGMLVFDKWTCNIDGRQVIFKRDLESSRYRATMIDQGFCFNAGEWSFPDAPLHGLYARNRVYEAVIGMESFDRWISRLEEDITQQLMNQIVKEIPLDWYEDDYDALSRLVERLYVRRTRVAELLWAAKKTTRQPFTNWLQGAESWPAQPCKFAASPRQASGDGIPPA